MHDGDDRDGGQCVHDRPRGCSPRLYRRPPGPAVRGLEIGQLASPRLRSGENTTPRKGFIEKTPRLFNCNFPLNYRVLSVKLSKRV